MVQDLASTEAMKKSLLVINLSFIQNGFHTDKTNDKGETIWNIIGKQQTDHQDTISFLVSVLKPNKCFIAICRLEYSIANLHSLFLIP